MQEFLNDIIKPYWWISVVIIGMLINLLSSYLRKVIDKSASKYSSKWKNKSIKTKEQFEKRVAELRNNAHEVYIENLEAISAKTSGLFIIIMATSSAHLALFSTQMESIWITIIPMLFALLLMFIGMQYFMKGLRKEQLIRESRQNNPSNNTVTS